MRDDISDTVRAEQDLKVELKQLKIDLKDKDNWKLRTKALMRIGGIAKGLVNLSAQVRHENLTHTHTHTHTRTYTHDPFP
jgi:hypothetical protein